MQYFHDSFYIFSGKIDAQYRMVELKKEAPPQQFLTHSCSYCEFAGENKEGCDPIQNCNPGRVAED